MQPGLQSVLPFQQENDAVPCYFLIQKGKSKLNNQASKYGLKPANTNCFTLHPARGWNTSTNAAAPWAGMVICITRWCFHILVCLPTTLISWHHLPRYFIYIYIIYLYYSMDDIISIIYIMLLWSPLAQLLSAHLYCRYPLFSFPSTLATEVQQVEISSYFPSCFIYIHVFSYICNNMHKDNKKLLFFPILIN